MPVEQLTIQNQDGVQLAARLERPNGVPVAHALFAHCFTCTKNLRAIAHISRALAERGIAVLRFDFTGLGESEGEFADTNFSSNIADLIAVADYMRQELDAPALLIGHSLGGAAMLQAAHAIPEAKAVVTIGAPADPTHVRHLIKSDIANLGPDEPVSVEIAGRTFSVKQQFLHDLEEAKMRQSIGNLDRALLVLHAPLDQTVGIDNAAQIFIAAKHPKSFISLDQADHLLSDPADSQYAAAVIAAWAGKYIGRAPVREVALDPAGHTVAVRTEDTYRTDVIAGNHRFVMDEPLRAGGTDMGATPYDHLLAALGACTSITLRMYADRKEWPLESVIVRLSHAKVHARDCADCETKEGRIDCIECEIELFGDLDSEQRTRLHEIANKCPVHRTLHSEIKVRTRVKGDNL